MQLNLKSITVNIKNIFLQIRFLFSPSQNKKVNMRLVPMTVNSHGEGGEESKKKKKKQGKIDLGGGEGGQDFLAPT